jgi:hypothetical protein
MARTQRIIAVTASSGVDATQARTEIRALMGRKGHAVDNARAVMDRLERAFAEGALQRTPLLEQATTDLGTALEPGADHKVGGKSAEASRFILRAIDRVLDDA